MWYNSEVMLSNIALSAALLAAPVSADNLGFFEAPVVEAAMSIENRVAVPTVPFYSQFDDITSVKWQKVGCGIASLAMIIDYFNAESVSADKLLKEGIEAKAFIKNAGWSHAGLISMAKKYGLTGSTQSESKMSAALETLKISLEDGPVMASVHYTFDPKNPIPHLVVINGIKGDIVYYNDPAEKTGGGEISLVKFKKAWKKRFIELRPVKA